MPICEVSESIIFPCIIIGLSIHLYPDLQISTQFFLFLEKFILEDPKNYTFLSHGQQTIPSLDDTEEFQLTWDAMRIMCISEEDIISICKVISGTLLFGNMVFKQERNSDQAILPDDTVAQKVAHLFGINVNDMIKAFMRPRIKVGRDYVTKAQTKVINTNSLES